MLLSKTSLLFTSCVKISEQYIEFCAKYSLFNLKPGSKSEVTKIVIWAQKQHKGYHLEEKTTLKNVMCRVIIFNC